MTNVEFFTIITVDTHGRFRNIIQKPTGTPIIIMSVCFFSVL